jgi:hypothetical protein
VISQTKKSQAKKDAEQKHARSKRTEFRRTLNRVGVMFSVVLSFFGTPKEHG